MRIKKFAWKKFLFKLYEQYFTTKTINPNKKAMLFLLQQLS